MNIAVGSTSVIKLRAVREACRLLGVHSPVEGINVPSDIPVQPLGYEETRRGASNRARGVHLHRPHAVAIGIENGIRHIRDYWEDFSVVVVRVPTGEEYACTSAYVRFPTDAVEAMFARGRERTTVGAVLSESTNCNPTDPHSHLTQGRQSRRAILTKNLIEALSPILGLEPLRHLRRAP